MTEILQPPGATMGLILSSAWHHSTGPWSTRTPAPGMRHTQRCRAGEPAHGDNPALPLLQLPQDQAKVGGCSQHPAHSTGQGECASSSHPLPTASQDPPCRAAPSTASLILTDAFVLRKVPLKFPRLHLLARDAEHLLLERLLAAYQNCGSNTELCLGRAEVDLFGPGVAHPWERGRTGSVKGPVPQLKGAVPGDLSPRVSPLSASHAPIGCEHDKGAVMAPRARLWR